MSTQTAFRPERSQIDHAAPRADQRYRLSPDAIASVSQSAADRSAGTVGRFGWIHRLVETMRVWRDRAYSRRELATFDRRLLRDIGVSPYDAGREIAKPFWRD